MITDYIGRKNEVIKEYEHFDKNIAKYSNILKEAKLPNSLLHLKILLDDAKRKHTNISEDRFRLMIAGEAKSGKSTFINAYLGVELLPMDVKQCTSSIIEIKYGSQFRLLATYADDRIKEFKDEFSIKLFLKENASLHDDFRDIPVPTINHDILVRYGRKNLKNDYTAIPKSVVEEFISAKEIKAANIYNIQNYDDKIRSYISENKDKWKDIVVKIEIFFPFQNSAFKGIEIIDSPGVCARGGVAEITENYIKKADAIIFLKPISGQALESSQFSEFMKNTSVERNKNALFLVLTRAANVTPADLKILEMEAHKQFNQIKKENIIIIDSKAELYASMFEYVDDIKLRLRELNEEGTLDALVKEAWFDSMGNKPDFIKYLKRKSNFIKIDEVLSLFCRKAHYIALQSLLDTISTVYNRIINDLELQIDCFYQKAEDPTNLAKKIGELKLEIEEIKNRMYSTVNELTFEYTKEDGVIRKKITEEIEKYKSKVNKIDITDDNCFFKLKNEAMNKVNQLEEFQLEIQKEFVEKADAVLVEISKNNKIAFTSIKPDFSEQTFEEIKASTQEKAQEVRSFKEGITFKTIRFISEYSRNKHFDIIKTNIEERLDIIKNDLTDNLINFVIEVSKQYSNKLADNAKAKKEELDAIFKAKLNAEEIHSIIKIVTEFKILCQNLKSESEKIKGGIDKYVQ